MRLTVGQALVRFLAAQVVERDGERRRFFGGCFGIFGHGNVAGLGQALQQHEQLPGGPMSAPGAQPPFARVTAAPAQVGSPRGAQPPVAARSPCLGTP